MIPQNRLSATAQVSAFLSPDNEDTVPWADKELGGVALNDPSQGLQVKVWTLRLVGSDVRISAVDVAETTLFSAAGITELSLAFDQNMRPYVAYVQNGVAKYRWYNTLTGLDEIATLPAGAITPRMCLDDKRDLQYGASDVILAYILDDKLYFRAQRDRFGVDYLLKENVGGTIVRVGMNEGNRLQFLMETV